MKTTAIKLSNLFHLIITVCIFTAFSIAQNIFSIEVGDGTIDVLYSSDADIGGFQFTVEGATVTGASGGDAAANGFMLSCNSSMCLGFSMTGSVIPNGNGTLVIVTADITGDVSLSGIVVSDAAGGALDFTYDDGGSSDADYVVEVSSNVFTPDHLDISAGETVEWVNIDGLHNVDGLTDTYPNNPESFYSGSASSESWTYSFTFAVAGNYDYECNPHASMGMVGTITVGSGGCTDDMACNYNSGADFDDGSCLENDCAEVCGGSAVEDECGECGGDGSSCASSIIDILYNTTTDIGGFQFMVEGATVTGAFGGDATVNGFMMSSSATMVLGFSLTGAVIPSGSGVLVQVEIVGDTNAACLSAVVLSDPVGVAIENEVTDCLTISQVETIWGCTDESACNYNADATDNDGSCSYAEENYDCYGNCTAGEDCFGDCGGDAVVDECGICGGDGIGGHACDCDGNVEDCAGECGGSAVEDECGECGGDGTSCIPGVFGLALNADGSLDVTYNTQTPIYGFQFNVSDVTLTGASGGAAGDAGFMVSSSATTVVGFSLSGAFIEAGSGVLTVLSFDGSGEACLSDIVVAESEYGDSMNTESGDCATIEGCDDVDADGICDDVDDCVGAYDECGECNGDGIDEGACDCDGNVDDCAGECGGSAVIDECGECGGDGIDEGACDCDGNVEDCVGECGGSADGSNNQQCCEDDGGAWMGDSCCSSGILDCNGDCNGSAVVDECGECGGDGIDEGACDCDGNVEDCAGECGGSSSEDCAGICGGASENCPDWGVDDPGWYGEYQFTATIVAGLVIYDDVQLGDEGDELAAFDASGNLRGVGSQLIPSFGPYEGMTVYEMALWSNAAGDLISFQYYDASTDEVLDVSTTYTFVINDQLGNLVLGAYELIITSTVDLSIDLIAGWNWISLNVLPEDPSIASVLSGLGADAEFINSQASGSSTNYEAWGGGWEGLLATFDPGNMYYLKMLAPATLVVTGMPVEVASTPINLIAGWNWLGYLPQNPGAVSTALSSLGADAEFINSQASGSSTNYEAWGGGWEGLLATFEPGLGYLLKMLAPAEFHYPEFDGFARLTENKQEVILSEKISDWDFHYGDYEFIGTITASIENHVDADGDVVAVFVDGKCRGLAERMYFPLDDTYYYMIQVYSNEAAGEELTFKYYDEANDEVIEYSETLTFENNMIVGNGFNTFGLIREARLSQLNSYSIGDAYPNPFNPVTSFDFTIPEDGMVSVAVYDINGRMVAELANGYRSAGTYPVTWDANDLSSGVYMIHMISGDFSTKQKVMLIK